MSLTTPYREQFLIADGVTTIFPFDDHGDGFDAISKNYVKCEVYNADGSVIVPDFTVDLSAKTITITSLTTPDGQILNAPQSGAIVRIYRDVPETQNTTVQALQASTAKQIVQNFDNIVAMIQELQYANEHFTLRSTLPQRDLQIDLLRDIDDQKLVYWDKEKRKLVVTNYRQDEILLPADKEDILSQANKYSDAQNNVLEERINDNISSLESTINGKLAAAGAQIDANADAILKTREDFASADQAIRDDMNAEDSRLQTQITAQAAAITTNKNDIDELGDDVAEIQAKIPESASGTNHLITKQQLLDEEMDIRDDVNEMVGELQTQITAQAAAIATLDSEKLDKNQGSINAGKILTVGEDGLVVPSTGGTGGGLQAVSHDETLSGAGTDESPLGLSEAIKDEISNKLDKEYASDFRGEWPNYASVPSDSKAYPADTLGSHTPNFNDYIVVKDSSDYFVASSKNLLEADVVGAIIQSTPAAKFIVNYDAWYLGVAYNGYMGSNVPLATFHSGVGTISFISNSADSYGVCRFVRLKPNTTYTISAKNGGRCAIASLTDEGSGYSKFSTHIQTPTSLPITFTTNDNSTYGIVLYANSHGTECTFEEIQLEVGSVATSYEVSGGYYLEGTWRFKYAGVWDTNNKAGWTPEYRLDIDISHINNESIQTKDLTVGTGEGTINIGIVAGTATIATNNGLDIVAQTKFDTAPTTDDNTTWANALDTSLVRKAQVAAAISSFEALPDQTGNAGKFLKTDGSKASWEKVPQAGTKVIIRRGI